MTNAQFVKGDGDREERKKFMRGEITFNESGVVHYRDHDQDALAAWSEETAEYWRRQLKLLEAGEVSEDTSK